MALPRGLKWGLILIIIAGLSACGELPSSSSPTPSAEPPTAEPVGSAGPLQPAALGAPLYLNNCTPCHGNQGQGVDAPPLANSAYVQHADDATLEATIASGFSGTEMPAWLNTNGGPFTKTQISYIAAYLRTLQPAPVTNAVTPTATEPSPLPAGNAADGKVAFGQYCAACHGPEGVQGIPNPGSNDGTVPPLNPLDPEIKGNDAAAFTSNVLDVLNNGSIPDGSDPLLVMPSFGKSQMLTRQQLSNLIAYLMQINGVQPSK